MTYSRTTCGESSTMSTAGVVGLTWAGAPNQACTTPDLPTASMLPLCPKHLPFRSQYVSVKETLGTMHM